MISKLTPKQEKLMVEVRNEWINRFNSLEFNEELCTKLVYRLYEIGGCGKPLVIILDSPLALQFACNIGKESQVWSQVGSQVGSQKLRYFSEAVYGRADDALWLSWCDYYNRIGVHHNQLFLELKELFKCGIFTSIQQEKICYVSRPPVYLNRDEQGNMHSTHDYAIYFKDGFGLHYVHGVYFSLEDFNKFFKGKATAEEIIGVSNTEQKAVLIQHYGYGYVIEGLGAEIIDTENCVSAVTGRPTQNQLLRFKLGGTSHLALQVEDHSVHKKTILGVPNTIKNCKEARTWTFPELTEEDWTGCIES